MIFLWYSEFDWFRILFEALFDDVQALFLRLCDQRLRNYRSCFEFGPHPENLPRPKISLGYEHSSVH